MIAASSVKLKQNDSVVENGSDSQGLITNFGYNWASGGYWFEYTSLQDGSENDINAGDSYRIFLDYVDRCEYDL